MNAPARSVGTLTPKDTAEVDTLPFDFSASLLAGETLASASVSAEVHHGTDPLPAALLSGAPVVQGDLVFQRLFGGVAGVTYLLRCAATLSSGRVLVAAAYLPVVRL